MFLQFSNTSRQRRTPVNLGTNSGTSAYIITHSSSSWEATLPRCLAKLFQWQNLQLCISEFKASSPDADEEQSGGAQTDLHIQNEAKA